ncbi:hypothetical protein PsYK624_047110 [Phanerochaete sordida]|uniref:Uncharacterized protein n=1 Tax=Phanerochaete sordida TaxID=48140 RepID=A0A9P3G5F8_9APHY|nr:hypothetical protein PsYK624_047110 [Phanerochaete sordida]
MDALVRLVAGSAVPAPTPPSGTFHVPIAPPSHGQATHQPYPYPYYPYHYAYPPYYYSYPYGYTYPYASSPYQPPPAPTTSTDQPQIKKRKLSHVPAGASEWDVPYPFPDGQGPPDYYQNWQKLRGQQLVEDLVGLVKSAAKKAAVQKVQGEGSSGPAIGSVEYYRERVLRHYQPQGRYEGQPTPQPAPSPAVTPARSSTASKEAVVHSEPTPPSHEDHARIAVKVQHPTPAVPSPPMEGLVPPPTTASPVLRAPAASPHAVSTATETQRLTHAVPEGVHEEPSQAASANTCEATPDQTLAQIADNTQHNIDDLLAIFNDLPAQDIDALLSSTDFSSINPEDFGFGAAFDMTGLSPADGEAGVGQEAEAAASTSAADPHPFDIDFGFDPSIPLDMNIDPELLALSHPGPPPPTASEAAPQPAAEKPTVQISNMASGSGAPPTPTLVGSPMSHADFDPPTPEWNFQFPEPDIAGSERAGSEARSEQDAPQETPKDKGKARAAAAIDVDRADTPVPVDVPGAGTASRGSEAPDASTRRQFDIPTMPEWAPPPPPFTVLDVLGPLRKTLEAYLPAQRSRVPSLLVAPPAVPAKPAGATQAKDREDILRRARAMRAQLQEEIERAKVELWETAMEGGCLAVLAKERDKLVEKKS